jgi:hypothetical protein
MKRSTHTLVACACVIAVGAVASAPAIAAAPPPRAAVTSTCGTSSKPAGRKITVQATMRPVTNTKKMMLELLLQDRVIGVGVYKTIALPASSDFGFWLLPTPPTLGQNPNDVWNLSKTETHLVPGYSFRIRVKFRWMGKGGKVLKHQALLTKPCKQPATSTKKARQPSLRSGRARLPRYS